MNKIKILTYNIHKGFNAGNTTYALKTIKQSIQKTHADLVFLQEVIGDHRKHDHHMDDWINSSQFEYLADQTWPHFSYGKNALYTEGHHGNAILSKYPIHFTENEDVSFSKIERRGLLHATIEHGGHTLHAFCVHLGLFEKDRHRQVLRLCARISKMVPPEASIIIAGDFNDWRKSTSEVLKTKLQLKEAFMEVKGRYAMTFPSWFPCLSLDRVYYRNLKCTSAKIMNGDLWRKQSDHLPLLVEFEFPESTSE